MACGRPSGWLVTPEFKPTTSTTEQVTVRSVVKGDSSVGRNSRKGFVGIQKPRSCGLGLLIVPYSPGILSLQPENKRVVRPKPICVWAPLL